MKERTPEQNRFIDYYYNTLVTINSLNPILEESRAAVLTMHIGEGDNKTTVLLDKKYIADMVKIGGWIHYKMNANGLGQAAKELTSAFVENRTVDRERLLQIDQEYNL